MNMLPSQRARRFIAEFSVERDMEANGAYGGLEGGPTYQVHVGVTYGGCAAQGPSYACGGQPAEGPEWEVVGIDGEVWRPTPEGGEYIWLPIEQTHSKDERESVESWAEMLDLDDEVEEALRDEHEAALEWRAEQRRDPLE